MINNFFLLKVTRSEVASSSVTRCMRFVTTRTDIPFGIGISTLQTMWSETSDGMSVGRKKGIFLFSLGNRLQTHRETRFFYNALLMFLYLKRNLERGEVCVITKPKKKNFGPCFCFFFSGTNSSFFIVYEPWSACFANTKNVAKL